MSSKIAQNFSSHQTVDGVETSKTFVNRLTTANITSHGLFPLQLDTCGIMLPFGLSLPIIVNGEVVETFAENVAVRYQDDPTSVIFDFLPILVEDFSSHGR